MASEFSEKVTQIINGDTADLLHKLHGRWQDEHEYEDFSEYEAVIRKSAEGIAGLVFTKATKRPFGFMATLDGKKLQIFVKLYPRYQTIAVKCFN